MSVYLTIPSKRPLAEVAPVLEKWRERGYRLALWRDWGDSESRWDEGQFLDVDVSQSQPGPYPGYARAVNTLIADLLIRKPDAEWFVCAGDDMLPDPNHTADEIAGECRAHFHALACVQLRTCGCITCRDRVETLGVMQPTGDRWGTPERPGRPARAYIDHVAGSAWIGREFARRAYKGNGPYWPEYFHMGVDEELQKVATKLGLFWQRPDLTQHHQHWGRPKEGQRFAPASNMPEFLAKANSPEEWKRYKAIMTGREADGFPGSELLDG